MKIFDNPSVRRFNIKVTQAMCLVFIPTSLLACSKSSDSLMQCSGTKSLLRWDLPSIPSVTNAPNFFSNGGFIEVFTRKDVLGLVDSHRLCTAYVEFSNNPAQISGNVDADPLTMNIFTASHCLDMSRDYAIKIHLFDGSIYRDFWVDYKPLEKINALRAAAKMKGLSSEIQKKVLQSVRTSAPSLEGIFNAPTISSNVAGTGASTTAGKICLQKDNPDVQHVCATYHDLTALTVEPSANSPAVVINELKVLRKNAIARALNWITISKLAANQKSEKPRELIFQDDPETEHTLTSVHKEMRERVHLYSKFKNVQFMQDELLPDLNTCSTGSPAALCRLSNEISAFVKAQLLGTGYEVFEDSKLSFTVDALKTGFSRSVNKMDKAFTVFGEFLEDSGTSGAQALQLETRVHSNFRFVTGSEPTQDIPDPKDSVLSGRGFMHFNVNNLTGDNSGASASFVKWAPSPSTPLLGRFAYFSFPKKFTDAVRSNYSNRPIPQAPHVGFMQAGDSGSIVVIEQMPFFTITSVDGVASSGGAGIRPLPAPMDESELDAVKRGMQAAGSSTAQKRSSAVSCR